MKKIFFIFLSLVKISFSHDSVEDNNCPTVHTFLYYDLAKSTYQIPAIKTEPLMIYAKTHLRKVEIYNLCARIEHIQTLNTTLRENLRLYDFEEAKIFNMRIFENVPKGIELALSMTSDSSVPLTLYYNIACKIYKIATRKFSIFQNRHQESQQLTILYEQIKKNIENLTVETHFLLENLEILKDETYSSFVATLKNEQDLSQNGPHLCPVAQKKIET